MKYLASILLCLWICLAYGQEIRILDRYTNSAIPGVAVYNENKTKSEISDFTGKVNLDKFLDNEVVYFQHLSYNTISYVKSEIPSIACRRRRIPWL